jgi:UDP-N-acetylmuramoylalanine--D-glutamate ligase
MSGPRALVYGVAITGRAVAEALQARGYSVVLADDSVDGGKQEWAAAHGMELVAAPDGDLLDGLLGSVELVHPAPAIAETHRLIAAATRHGVPLRTELDLAYQWEQGRRGGPRPMVAVTGTDGKTTTTAMTAAMIGAAGHRTAPVGNTETPLVAALDTDAEVFVVEASSFRLAFIDHFRAEASAWINLAPDHLNWHASLETYEAAKARMWAHVLPGDVVVGNALDPIVMRNLRRVPAQQRTVDPADGDYRVVDGWLTGPIGRIAEVAAMSRRLPHDITNALTASALALESGWSNPDAIAIALASFQHPPHRIEPLGTFRGVDWFNDSKATTPHAALTAMRGFERIVLMAGGQNKNLDLSVLAEEAWRVRAVVALGESAPLIAEVFAGRCPVVTATSMAEGVALADGLAEPGDTVLLSPACASFDWYDSRGYVARGEDFKQLVNARFGGTR